MGDKSTIEWTEATWNPVTGCDYVSPGCEHCYALALARRLKAMGNPRYQVDGNPRTSGPGFGLTLHEDQLDLPLRWKRSRHVFVNSMSDLFHEEVSEEFIARVFRVMEEAGHHTFQILTKRPRRMMRILGSQAELPNVWLGVSVESQEWANRRVPLLLGTEAAVRFVSAEPLIGPLDLNPWLPDRGPLASRGQGSIPRRKGSPGIDWVIVGGESGPKARPMEADWARNLRDQCTSQGVAFFFKQWGGRTSKAGGRELDGRTWDELPTFRKQE
jgi:protein gp37